MGTLTDNQIEAEQAILDEQVSWDGESAKVMIGNVSYQIALKSKGEAWPLVSIIEAAFNRGSENERAKVESELTTLRAEVEQLRAHKAECESQEKIACGLCDGTGCDPMPTMHPVCCGYPEANGECCGSPTAEPEWGPCEQCYGNGHVYLKPIPSDRVAESELSLLAAIAKSPSWADIEVPKDLQTEDDFFNWLHSQRDAPRITEQDAREIAQSALSFWRNTVNLTLDVWLKDHAPTLLNKLNAGRVSVPVMPEAMPDNVHSAINWQLGPNHKIASTAKGLYDAIRNELLSASPAKTNSEGEDFTIINFGKGEVLVEGGLYGGLPAIFVRKSPVVGVVGGYAPPELASPKHEVMPGEVVMTFQDKRCAEQIKAIIFGESPAPDSEGDPK